MDIDPDELERLAHEHFDKGEYLPAKACYEKLVQLVPLWEDGNAVYELGLCYEKLGLHSEALKQFYQAYEIRPYDSFFLYKVAEAEVAYGNLHEALARNIELLALLLLESPGAFSEKVFFTEKKLAGQLEISSDKLEYEVSEAKRRVCLSKGNYSI